MVTSNQSKNSAIHLVFTIGFVMMCLKFVAYFMTESTAILTDAFRINTFE